MRNRMGLALAVLLSISHAARAEGDPERGVFHQCIACHSAASGEHLTGPSLVRVWDHKAGTVEGFGRYSDAMKRAEVKWNESTLDKWLQDPERLVPGTGMTFPGIKDARARADVIAYLHAVSEDKSQPSMK